MKKSGVLILTAVLALSCQYAFCQIKTETAFQIGSYKYSDESSASIYVDFSVEYVVSSMNSSVASNINSAIIQHVFGKQEEASVPRMLEQFKDNVVEEYRSESDGANWSRTGKSYFSTNYGQYRSYVLEFTSNEGASKPMVNKIGTVFNMKSGKEVDVTEFFLPGYDMTLCPVISRLRNDGKNAGVKYYSDKLISTNNYTVSSKGITFIYNPYDVAPASAGVIEITVPWSEIKSIINKD